MAKQKYRRKAVACVLCDEPTFDVDKVCLYCREQQKIGAAVKSGERDSNLVLARIGAHWRFYAFDTKESDLGDSAGKMLDKERSLTNELQRLLSEIANVQKIENSLYMNISSPIEFVIGQAYDDYGRTKDSFSYRSSKCMVDHDTGIALQRIIEIVRALRAIAGKKAKEKAEHFLLSMAKGEITYEEIGKPEN